MCVLFPCWLLVNVFGLWQHNFRSPFHTPFAALYASLRFMELTKWLTLESQTWAMSITVLYTACYSVVGLLLACCSAAVSLHCPAHAIAQSSIMSALCNPFTWLAVDSFDLPTKAEVLLIFHSQWHSMKPVLQLANSMQISLSYLFDSTQTIHSEDGFFLLPSKGRQSLYLLKLNLTKLCLPDW